MAIYTATRIEKHFFEEIDGQFNIDAEPHWVDLDEREFESMSDLVDAVKRDGVRFDATGSDWAGDRDGSYVIDYRTAERCTVSWHFDAVSPALLSRVIVPAVDGI